MKNYTPIDHLIKQTKHMNKQHPSHTKNNQTPHAEQAISFHAKGPESAPINNTIQAPEHSAPSEQVEKKDNNVSVFQSPPQQPQNNQPKQETKKITGMQPVIKTGKYAHLQNVKIPIADEKVLEGKHAPITSSIRWLSELATYILRKAHIQLKRVGGHVVRVIAR